MQRYYISRTFFYPFFGNFTLIRLRKQHALKGFAICQHALKGFTICQHALKGFNICQQALKGQKLLAQGIALGNHRRAPLAL